MSLATVSFIGIPKVVRVLSNIRREIPNLINQITFNNFTFTHSDI